MPDLGTFVQGLLDQLTQLVPGGAGPNRAVRTLTQVVTGPILLDGAIGDLDDGTFEFQTEFFGPWQCNILSIQFTAVDELGEEIPDRSPRDVEFGFVLGNRQHPIFEETACTERGFVITDPNFKLGPDDQVYVKVSGNDCFAHVEVRGTSL